MKSMQVTLNAGPTSLASNSAVVTMAPQLIIQNNAAHSCRVGGPAVTNAIGISLASAGGTLNWQTQSYLTDWFIQGTSGDVIDIMY
jgi:hypothetical protein